MNAAQSNRSSSALIVSPEEQVMSQWSSVPGWLAPRGTSLAKSITVGRCRPLVLLRGAVRIKSLLFGLA
jgi:hypothetical protein